MSHVEPLPNPPACSMPEHGQETAPHACCRPSTWEKKNTGPSRVERWKAHWSDRRAWKTAARNTWNCLVGCSIGDFSVLIYLQMYHPTIPMSVQMILAMAAGLVTSVIYESILLRLREKFSWRDAVTTAFSMSFISMLGMEFVANMTGFMMTGGSVPVSDPYYWFALLVSLGAGYLAPLPYNYAKFKTYGKSCH